MYAASSSTVGRAAEGGRPVLDADPGGPAGVVAGARGVAAGLALGRPVGRFGAGCAVAPRAVRHSVGGGPPASPPGSADAACSGRRCQSKSA